MMSSFSTSKNVGLAAAVGTAKFARPNTGAVRAAWISVENEENCVLAGGIRAKPRAVNLARRKGCSVFVLKRGVGAARLLGSWSGTESGFRVTNTLARFHENTARKWTIDWVERAKAGLPAWASVRKKGSGQTIFHALASTKKDFPKA
ncbi:MAG: hypothetical protein ACK4Q5_14330 [Saprospiraceae bacterium]